MALPMKELVELSRRYGADPDFVLVGGGNTSCKDGSTLAIKASGSSLASIRDEDFVRMDRAKLAALWSTNYPKGMDAREEAVLADLLAAKRPGQGQKRPSVETLLHDLFDQTFVVHTHPPLVNGLTCSKQGRNAAERHLGKGVVWAPSMEPGYTLGAAVKKAIDAFRAENGGACPSLVLMENHGMLVAGESPAAIQRETNRVLRALKKAVPAAAVPDFKPAPFDRERIAALAPAVRALAWGEGPAVAVFDTNKAFLKLLANKTSFAAVNGPFTPDHIVYCHHAYAFVPYVADLEKQYRALEKTLAAYEKKHGHPPRVVAIQKTGVFAVAPTRKQAEDALFLFTDAVRVAAAAKPFGGSKFMSKKQTDFIRGWEAEAFRRRVAAGGGGGGGARLSGKVVVITGGAQGFGHGIAAYLLDEGAHVILADLNLDLANEAAAAFNAEHGRGRALAVAVNVGDEASVRAMVEEACLAYGGIDAFISNAGVLKAGGLEQMDLESFEFVTRVNYTGYFLCTKYASRPMKIHHRFRPADRMDIIQVNSKSGLTGSKNNFAYAGGKFGGIGLTQSFALELVDQGIKVNAVCPGNFFHGPLWSDPQRGLFVQYLKSNKVPGAKSIDDVRAAYEAKVPMKRGCETADVGRAIVYLIEQPYETGQALPVTGGQEMLK